METANSGLAPDAFEAIVTAIAETLVKHYRERWLSQRNSSGSPPAPPAAVAQSVPPQPAMSPWLTVVEAAKRARCGRSTVYSAIQAGHLRVARVGGGRICRVRVEWVDEWLQGVREPARDENVRVGKQRG